MKKTTLFLTILFVLVAFAARGEEVPKKIYAFGVSASFNDSTVYITEIHEVDSAWVNRSTKFLYSRNNYSYQLRDYIRTEMSVSNPVSSITFAFSEKAIARKYAKMRRKFAKKGIYRIIDVSAADFRFQPIAAAEEYKPLTRAERRAERKAEKAERKAQKKSKKDKRPKQRPTA